MAGFDPNFTPAAPGTGQDGTVPAPGDIDGTRNFMRADGTWAIPLGGGPITPPPAPGPDLNQWACNVAGWLTYDVARFLVKHAVDLIPVTWIGDVVTGIVSGVLDVILPAAIIEDGLLDAIITTWITAHVNTFLTDFGAAVLDDVLWAKIHCALYDAIVSSPTDLQTAILAAGTVIAGLGGYSTGFFTGLNYLLQHLGITTFANLPLPALAANYDCSTCATTHIGPTKALLQNNFDLTVKGDSGSETFVDNLTLAGGVITGTAPAATWTPDTASDSGLGMVQGDGSTVHIDSSGIAHWVNPMTTSQDLIVGGSSGGATRLGKGSDGQVLTVDPSTHLLVWATPAAAGMANPMTTQDDVIVAGSGGTPTRLAKGTDGQVLTIDATSHHVAWDTPAASGMSNPMTTLDDLILGGASGTPTRLGVGSPNQFVGADPVSGHVTYQNLVAGSGITLVRSAGQTEIATAGTGAGGTACTQIGKVKLLLAVGGITFTTIPSGFSSIMLEWRGRSDDTSSSNSPLFLRINGDTANHYNWMYLISATTGTGGVSGGPVSGCQVGFIPAEGPSSTASTAGTGKIWLPGYDDATWFPSYHGEAEMQDQGSGGRIFFFGLSGHLDVLGAVTTLELFPQNGNWEVGSQAVLWGFI